MELTRMERNRMMAEDKDALVVENMGLVTWQIDRQYMGGRSYSEDLAQAGYEALVKAAEKWDPDKGSFTTYALNWVKNHIDRAYNEVIQNPYVPEGQRRHLRTERYFREDFWQEHQREPTDEEVEEALGVGPAPQFRTINIDNPINFDPEASTYADSHLVAVDEPGYELVDYQDELEAMPMTPEQRAILLAKAAGWAYVEIAEAMDVPTSRVERLAKEAKEVVRGA